MSPPNASSPNAPKTYRPPPVMSFTPPFNSIDRGSAHAMAMAINYTMSEEECQELERRNAERKAEKALKRELKAEAKAAKKAAKSQPDDASIFSFSSSTGLLRKNEKRS